MAIRRFFYVTQEALVVWKNDRSALTEEITFQSSDEGYRLFSAYLERSAQQRSLMVVDVIEEEFVTDSVPELSTADRKALIDRRLAKRFARTPYRLGKFQGKRRRATDRFNVVLSAITNHELLDPWLRIIDDHRVPLTGITSVPLAGPELLHRLWKPAENALLLTRHQGGRLRQIFIKSGQVVSARLSRVQSADGDDDEGALSHEIAQSRKYLERSRLLTYDDSLHVYLIAASDVAEQAFPGDSGIDFKCHVIEPAAAAAKIGSSRTPDAENIEMLFLAHCARATKCDNYVPAHRTNYSRLLGLRHMLIGLATAGAAACSIAAGIYMTEGLLLRMASQDIEAQIARLEETFRRENDEFEPIRADSHEMKLAVDTGEYILRNTLPVDWVMREVGGVLEHHPDMQLSALHWEIETATDAESPRQRRGTHERAMPVPIPEISAVTASLQGQIQPYSGDLRQAFSKIDALAASLQKETRFERVAVLEYPIDARPAASLSGEVRRLDSDAAAEFSLSLTLSIDDDVR